MWQAPFEWGARNLEHFAQHGVDPGEAEGALDHDPLMLRRGRAFIVAGPPGKWAA